MRRAFLVGCGRSGTTLLQSMLGAHPDIAIHPETAFFVCVVGQRSYRQQCPERRKGDYWDRLRTVLGIGRPAAKRKLEAIVRLMKREDLRPLAARRHLTIRGYARTFLALLDRLAADSGKTMWVEKSPRHIYYLDAIEHFAPDAAIIHLVRNGPDTIASLWDAALKYKSWRRNYPDLEECIWIWVSSVRIALNCLSRPNHFVMTYEDLVACPESVLTRLCNALGIAYSPAMLAERVPAAESILLPHEEWKRKVLAPVANANNTKFERLFDADQRARVQEACSAVNLSGLHVESRAGRCPPA